jgi:hypothetical protein
MPMPLRIHDLKQRFLITALFGLCLLTALSTKAAGVTVITHGLNGDIDGWVTGMANEIPKYYRFPGTNYSFYKLYFYYNNGYQLAWTRLGGSPPTTTDSGEILVAFDWSQLADGSSYNTYQIASVVAAALTSTNFIPELNGHALCELPIHLIGHSRGGSLMCESSRLLGTNGIWVDDLTTLDPHPLNNDGFHLDFLAGYSAVDAPCETYENVLFHGNCWENIDLFIRGESVAGAYNRQLTNLSGGYQNVGDTYYPHSNAHLWYHGSVDFDNPASDTEAMITATERNNWWVTYEDHGVISGFYYSLIGGGNRMSTDRPVGQAHPAIVDGYNQFWDLGAGTLNPNRSTLSSNNGSWPNIIKFNISGTNVVVQSNQISARLYYQYAGSSNLTMQVFFDQDSNPYNSNSTPILSLQPPATGSGSVYYYAGLGLATTNIPPGIYSIYAKISDGKHARYLYTPESVTVLSILQRPVLAIKKSGNSQFLIVINGVSGQKLVVQSSTDLKNWLSLETNTLASNVWDYTNHVMPNFNQQFYRVRLMP